jgi:hypothetical protein
MVKKSWHLKIGPTGYPETSVRNHRSLLCNIPEERRSVLHHRGSLELGKPEVNFGFLRGYDRVFRVTVT